MSVDVEQTLTILEGLDELIAKEGESGGIRLIYALTRFISPEIIEPSLKLLYRFSTDGWVFYVRDARWLLFARLALINPNWKFHYDFCEKFIVTFNV